LLNWIGNGPDGMEALTLPAGVAAWSMNALPIEFSQAIS
jgi:hypothetical protein